jgi:hypothetical protein
VGGHPLDWDILKNNLTAIGGVVVIDTVKDSRFPRAIGADEPKDLSLLYSRTYIIDGEQPAESPDYLF